MSIERMIIGAFIVGIICVTGLISQCSHRIGDCKKEAIKAGMKADEIRSICTA